MSVCVRDAASSSAALPTASVVAAIFDFDKTLIGKDSQEVEAQRILMKHFITRISTLLGIIGTVVSDFLCHRDWISTQSVNRIYVSSYKGIRLGILEEYSWQLYETYLKHTLHDEMIRQLENHRKEGHLIVVISATSEHLLRPFIQDFAVKAWKSSKVQVDGNGNCTGGIEGPVCCGHEKVRALQDIASSYHVDLSRSFAYSDHHHDIPMLEAVGNATVVNPTPILEQVAKLKGWKIRKCLSSQHPDRDEKNGDGKSNSLQRTFVFGVILSICMWKCRSSCIR